MTLDEKMLTFLGAMTNGLRWWTNAAAQNAVAPYGVVTQFGNPPLQTQDQQQQTRQWRYEFQVIDPQFLRARLTLNMLSAALLEYSDSPAPGIQRFISLGADATYLKEQRLHCLYGSFDIIENIPG